ncbi:putative ATPase [Kytococcus aerolatus]|uniref:Putative ATPase n=1 Tax=Kytococcus aerolatus TaxID=592308 RepID=A0A212SZZ3_9MICO|nr:replication-associated recombination protein A [Kytococcus aerolatus]SNC59176.1 putative ATPase [Kytococcus aerolatus]
MTDDLFSAAAASAPATGSRTREEVEVGVDPGQPLAARMRPRSLDEVVGQTEVLRAGSPLRRLIEGGSGVGASSSAILWGPPGTGKTTLARLVATAADRTFVQLSAVTAGVKDVRTVMESARREKAMYGRQTVLFLDEIHRFSKAQQDALLPGVEDRTVILVAATTENPSFSVVTPLLSRSLLVRLQHLTPDELSGLLDRALAEDRGLAGRFSLEEDARQGLLRLAGGDARRALTTLEAAAGAAEAEVPPGAEQEAGTGDPLPITRAHLEQAMDQAVVAHDRAGDQHYDVASAFIKSMRGSDVDAALHYLARQIAAGEDPRFIARRVVIAASEDVGMADPTALQTAVAAMHAVAQIGMPEARIVLAQAVVHVTLAPPSNAVYRAVDDALADVRAGRGGPVPAHLRDAHYAGAEGLGHGTEYVYAHDAPDGVAAQQHLPDDLVEARYYRPGTRGFEARLAERWERLRDRLRD